MMQLASVVRAKFHFGGKDEGEAGEKMDAQLASDCFTNHKTISSFGQNEHLGRKFRAYLEEKLGKAKKEAHFTGFVFGFTYLMVNLIFGCLFYCSGLFHDLFGDEAEGVLIAIYAIMLGATHAGTAQMFGPDVDKASKVSRQIIKQIERKSKTDPTLKTNTEAELNIDTIEFDGVWFRYPTKKDQWVFKGLNFHILKGEKIAFIGESGSGKSTVLALLLRFYEPNEGRILINKKNITNYSVS